MKFLFVVFAVLFILPSIVAQEPTKRCPVKKTIILRKKGDSPLLKEEKTTDIISFEKGRKPIPIEDTTEISLKETEQPLKTPTLAGGEFGLMNILHYRKGMELEGLKYVIIQYSISKYGWATKLVVFGTNDSQFKELVVRKLKRSKWNPGVNQAGQAIEYRMYKQIVIVEDRIYDENYFNEF